MNKRSLTVCELILAVCLIFILLGVFGMRFVYTLKIARETALQSELKNIRAALNYYRIVNGQFPRDLSGLTKERLTAGLDDSKIVNVYFLKSSRVDRQGNLLDPFGQKYIYNKEDGSVYSQTRGYERW